MKIDLSKYPPGTKFKTKCGNTVRLVGLSEKKPDCYIIEYLDDAPFHTIVYLGYRFKDGTYPSLDIRNYIESVIQPDKYLVSYKDQSDTIRTIVVVDPKSLTTDSFYESIKSVTSGYRQPYDILSWSKIEE